MDIALTRSVIWLLFWFVEASVWRRISGDEGTLISEFLNEDMGG